MKAIQTGRGFRECWFFRARQQAALFQKHSSCSFCLIFSFWYWNYCRFIPGQKHDSNIFTQLKKNDPLYLHHLISFLDIKRFGRLECKNGGPMPSVFKQIDWLPWNFGNAVKNFLESSISVSSLSIILNLVSSSACWQLFSDKYRWNWHSSFSKWMVSILQKARSG